MIRSFDLPSKMVHVFTNEARNIRMTMVIETRGFYEEERNFIYSVDKCRNVVKKATRIVQIISHHYKVID